MVDGVSVAAKVVGGDRGEVVADEVVYGDECGGDKQGGDRGRAGAGEGGDMGLYTCE